MDFARHRSRSPSSIEQAAFSPKRQRMDEDTQLQTMLASLDDMVRWDKFKYDRNKGSLLVQVLEAGKESGYDLVEEVTALGLLNQTPSALDILLRAASSSRNFTDVLDYCKCG
jgi:hypothetical protein